MILEAPLTGPVTALLLPNPQLGNTEAIDSSVDFKQSMNGTRYTYVKSSTRRRLTYEWVNMGRGKVVELIEFYRRYSGVHCKLIDHEDNIWDVVFTENPITTTMAGPVGGAVTLEFLGVQIA